MKKGIAGILALTTAAVLFGGCGKSGGDKSGDAEKYVSLGEYKGIEISVPLLRDEALELETVKYYFDRVSDKREITDRPVQMYDLANIDYEGKKDGVAFDGGTAQGADLLIGSGQFIDGFEAGLVGVMPGETVDLPLKFPDAYGSQELAGQEVIFTVKVNYVSEMEDGPVPAIGLDNVATTEQLRQYVRDSRYREEAENTVMSKLLSGAEFKELPKEMLDSSRQMYVKWLERVAQMYGMEAESFVSAQGLDYESLLQEYSEEHTKQQLVIEAIADQEGLNLSDEEFTARMNEYAQEQGLSVDELLQEVETKDNLRSNFLYEDVISFLVDNAVNTEQ